ncbi:MBG domain-containing protein [Polynucleobacter sp. AP-Melu-500A-A1]|uniref:beta strand repeat-containing protein n=1 Tax=Polynucleobacter sp. AP-Melu-500A-A1 TaxID=2576929 RepID=UPI001C0DFC5F
MGTGLAVTIADSLTNNSLGNYTLTQPTGFTANITPKALTVTGATASNKVYDGTNTASFTGGTLTGVVAADAANVTLTQAGTFSQANVGTGLAVTTTNVLGGSAAGNYTLTQTTDLTANITPAPITVTANDQTTTYGTALALGTNSYSVTGLLNGNTLASISLAQGGNATVPVTQSVATYSGSTNGIIASGAVAGAGTSLSNYAITYVPGVLTINPKALTITANNQSTTYGTALALGNSAFTATGLVNGDRVAGVTLIQGGLTSIAATQSVGSYSGAINGIIASGATGVAMSNYTISYISGSLTVNPATLTITATNQTSTYGSGIALGNSAFTTSGLVNGNSIASVTLISTGTSNTTNVGNYAIGISAAAAAAGTHLSNYAITYVPAVLSITPAPITVTANDQTTTYGTALALGTNSYSVTGLLNGNTLASISLAQGGNATVPVTQSVATYSGSTNGIIASGAVAGAGTSLSNYAITYVPGVLTINPKALTITANNQSTTYGTALALGNSAFTATGLVNGDAITSITINYLGGVNVAGTVNAGTYIGAGGLVASGAIASAGTSLANYNITYVNGSLTINPAALTVTANAQTMTYAANTLPSLTYTSSGLKNGDAPFTGALATTATAYNGSAGSASNVGIYTITQGTLSAGSNYAITYLPANLSVTPSGLIIATNAQAVTYGTTLNLGTTGYTSAGLLNGDSITGVGLSVSNNVVVPGTTNAGVYTIVSNNAAGLRLSNYNITYQTGVLTVNPKSINVVANTVTMVYADSALPNLTYQAVTGLVNGDSVTGSLTTTAKAYNGSAGSASNVGTYAITQGSLTAGNNYAITYTPANLTVTAANLTVTAANQSTTYGLLFVLPQSALSATGLRNGDYVSTASIMYNANQVVPGSLSAGTYANSIAISNAAGVGMSNYNISYIAANLTVNKGTLTVTAVSDGKLVTQADIAGSATNCAGAACVGGYAGVMISGFVNGDTVASGALGIAPLVITRTNAAINAAGLYNSVLMPSGLNPQNYTVQYVAGNYVIAPAEQLLVKMGNNTTAYGTAASYGSVTAAYLKTDGTVISGIPVTVSGSTISMNDGLGSTAQFTASPVNPVNSSSGNLSVGSYALGASSASITGANFNSMAVIGGLDVTPKQLAYADLGISGVAKVYDGSVNMNNLAITASSGFIAGDIINATALGSFTSKNVGNSIPYNIGVLLNGADKTNYQIGVDPTVNNGLYAGSNGVITQLNSVTYTGPNTGGNWSNPANWTTTGTTIVGAIPDLSNVANVIIPVGRSVVYDNAVAGPVTSAVTNNGNMNFNLSSAANIAMTIAGAGSVTISNSGPITLSGINNYVGGTTLNAGSNLIVGNGSAIGAPNIISNGSAINPTSFSTLSAVTLPYLNITGGTTQLLSNITTTGAQTYSDLILGSTVSGTTTLRTSNANINFMGKIDGATAKSQSLVANAGTGIVTIGDSVGSAARLNSIAMTGSSINILADIITAVGQTYNGNAFIGDAAYIGRAPTVGFLFSGYSSYFQYSTPAITSTIKYLNMNPIYVRTMISEDPNVTFNGTVNDLVPNTHTLLVAAIAPDATAGSSAAASVNFGASVGNVSPLYSLNTQVVVNQSQANSVSNYVGTVSLVGNVATYSDQTYRANVMTAQATAQPGSVTFSIYDPTANITYLLPLQTSGAGAGQMNLQNPNSLDALTINGANNYLANQNRTGTNNWGSPAVITPALGYVAPTFVPPAFVPVPGPTVEQAYFVPVTFPPPIAPMPPMSPTLGSPNAVAPSANSGAASIANTSIIAPMIQNSTNFVVYNLAQNSANVNVTMTQDFNVAGGSRSVAGMQAFNKDALIPKPESGMVNILVKVLINGEPTTLASSSPIQGFKFTVPETLLPSSIVSNTATLTASPATGSLVERAVQSDGSPLPTWLKYDPETNTFNADQIPVGAKPVVIKIQTVKNGQILEESPPILIDTK